MRKIDPSPQVAIIIISYNTRPLLLECLGSAVESSDQTGIELVVVDNASTDGSPEAVARAYPQAELITNRRNLGFAAACNQAIKATRSPFIILLNSDARLTRGGFQALYDCMKSIPRCAAAGCRLVNAEGRENISTRYFLNPINQA
ncbi:MAG TPA: glycosyltransferase, partial [Blastocatellia bacterium]|nr:glycosyltransferase [Blastocatellia bacterium]